MNSSLQRSLELAERAVRKDPYCLLGLAREILSGFGCESYSPQLLRSKGSKSLFVDLNEIFSFIISIWCSEQEYVQLRDEIAGIRNAHHKAQILYGALLRCSRSEKKH